MGKPGYSLRALSCGGGFIKRLEVTQEKRLPGYANRSGPTVAIPRSVNTNPTSLIGRRQDCIFGVFTLRDGPKVRDSVVVLDAVYVVNDSIVPTSNVQRQNDPMGVYVFLAESSSQVSVGRPNIECRFPAVDGIEGFGFGSAGSSA